MRKLLPILLALVGAAAGVGAGIALKPDPVSELDNPCGDPGDPHAAPAAALAAEVPTAHDYVKMNNQFVVPVVEDGRVGALVVLALSLEVAAGSTELVFEREPKLRDAFLQVLFDHANAGGFSGNFTAGSNMTLLRDALKEVAVKSMGPIVTDVLISDIVRQDS